jgi:hypothetical protein
MLLLWKWRSMVKIVVLLVRLFGYWHWEGSTVLVLFLLTAGLQILARTAFGNSKSSTELIVIQG